MPRFHVVALMAVLLGSVSIGSARAQDRPDATGARNAQVFAAALLLALVSGSPARGHPVLAAEVGPETTPTDPAKENPALLRRAGHLSPDLEETSLVQQE
jgi:hypothetical protein